MPITISKNLSLSLKGTAVLLMVLLHYGFLHVTVGVACVAMFAFITGYAQCLMVNQSENSTWSAGIRSLISFYKIFVLIAITVLGGMCLTGNALPLEKIIKTICLIHPNCVIDSWWYAFAFACYCLFLFPIVRGLDKLCHGKARLLYCLLFLIALCSLLLPCFFHYECVPETFRQIWGGLPILRTLMFVPYYIIGYTIAKSNFSNPQAGTICSGCLTLLCICWPFTIYTIPSIGVLNVAPSFVAFTLLTLFFVHNFKIRLLTKIGTISVYIWLLHMPIYRFLHHPFLHPIFNPENILAQKILNCIGIILSIICAWLFAWFYNKIFLRKKIREKQI